MLSLASMRPYEDQFEGLGEFDLVSTISDNTAGTQEDSKDGPFVQLANIPFVDDRELEWQQVSQFRHDTENRQKLERLQRFARAEFSGKSIAEVEDILMGAIESHKVAAKKHGIRTVETALTVGGGGTGVASLIAAIFGAAVAPAATIGATLGLGTALVKIVSARKVFELEQSIDPVRYIIDVQDTASFSWGV